MKRLALASLLIALAALAQEPLPPQPEGRKPPPPKGKPLSAEDEAIVKDLGLLENVDLLRDLELFEGKEQDGGHAQNGPERDR
jgi:hypothetical protein